MDIRNNTINPAFRGYKNVITNDIEYQDCSRMVFITMQLNDEDGKDLTKLRSIRSCIPEQHTDTDNDILTLTYSKFRNNPEFLFFDGRSMYLGDELLNLYNEVGDSYNYKREENVTMKAYTLIASLTRRMMHNVQSVYDDEMAKVFKITAMSFTNGDYTKLAAVMKFLSLSVNAMPSLKLTASFFNNLVVQNMSKFFQMKL